MLTLAEECGVTW